MDRCYIRALADYHVNNNPFQLHGHPVTRLVGVDVLPTLSWAYFFAMTPFEFHLFMDHVHKFRALRDQNMYNSAHGVL